MDDLQIAVELLLAFRPKQLLSRHVLGSRETDVVIARKTSEHGGTDNEETRDKRELSKT